MRGADVTDAQRELARDGYLPASAIDGIYGPVTANAAKTAKYRLGYPARNLTPVYGQLLHDYLTEDEKAQIVSLLWQIAYADGRLDKYEDSLVLKISDLLYVSRGRVMRLKHDAELAAG